MVSQTRTHSIPSPFNIHITSNALSSWMHSTRRLLKGYRVPFIKRARARHGSIIYTNHRPLAPADIIQDFYAELEADQVSPAAVASSRGLAPDQEPSRSSDRGRPVSIDDSAVIYEPIESREDYQNFIYRINVELNRELRKENEG